VDISVTGRRIGAVFENMATKYLGTFITVVKAKNVPVTHKLRDSSYYVTLNADGKIFKTTASAGRAPKWDQSFTM